ncbi:MAG: 2-amino-4-oxopentanoate thiolase subunit OrtA [Defluviitaleaceae bacterium]|nr:2-amino-4-oxopentanoate thiolase subunit OrtA [Defluviitaleaceae bacterium]
MGLVNSGTWVNIRSVILDENSRAAGIPQDTAGLPLMMWVKGFLTHDCQLGEKAEIITVTGRTEYGILEEANPATNIDYGEHIPEIAEIGRAAREVLFGG